MGTPHMKAAMNFGHYRNTPIVDANDRRIPGFLRPAIKYILRDTKVDIEESGIKFRCYPYQGHHDRLIVKGLLFEAEKEEFLFMEKHLENGGCMIDIGANIGAISIHLAARSKRPLKIVAIEPNPETAEKLKFNAEINALQDFVVVPCAVGPSGKLRLWRNKLGHSGQATVHKISKRGIGFVEVDSRPLLDIIRENGISKVDLLKIDIEGFEDQALLPFFQCAPQSLWPDAISIEQDHRYLWKENCIMEMQKLGYSIMDTSTSANTFLTRT